MKTKSLTAIILLCMLAIGHEVFAQANRERGKNNWAYWDKTGALICSCGTRNTIFTNLGNFEYACKPCPKCKLVWYYRIEKDNTYSKPYLKNSNKSSRNHKCTKDECFTYKETKNASEKTERITIRMTGRCNKRIYIPRIEVDTRTKRVLFKGYFILSETHSEETYNYKEGVDVKMGCTHSAKEADEMISEWLSKLR